jgi:hypothetical protein
MLLLYGLVVTQPTGAQETTFKDDHPMSKQGRRYIVNVVQQIEDSRGFMERCQQRNEATSAARKIRKLWANSNAAKGCSLLAIVHLSV